MKFHRESRGESEVMESINTERERIPVKVNVSIETNSTSKTEDMESEGEIEYYDNAPDDFTAEVEHNEL
jgi:hypothetical protein